MALVTRSASASMDVVTGKKAPQVSGLVAGEALDVAAPCYIKASDGKVWMANGTANDEAARVAGFTPRAVALGQPVTLYGAGTRFRYGSGLTPGAILYLAATAGRLDDAATTGDPASFATTPTVTVKGGTAQVLTATDIRVLRNF